MKFHQESVTLLIRVLVFFFFPRESTKKSLTKDKRLPTKKTDVQTISMSLALYALKKASYDCWSIHLILRPFERPCHVPMELCYKNKKNINMEYQMLPK